MSKSLCELKNKFKKSKDLKAYLRLVDNPTHACKRCGRVANKKRFLCKPKKMAVKEFV